MSKYVSLVLCLCLLANVRAHAGSGAHGADLDSDQNNPWFIGPQPIPYCVSLERGSKLSMMKAHQLIERALQQWKQFFIKYELDQVQFGDPLINTRYSVHLRDGVPRGLTLNFLPMAGCSDPRHEIQFRFSAKANDDWMLDSDHSMGAAIRGPYDHSDYRTGGVVWISSALESDEEFQLILLHELGHVFGMSHNSVYVMFQKITRILRANRVTPSPRTPLATIESPGWKYLFAPGDKLSLYPLSLDGRMQSTIPLMPFALRATPLPFPTMVNEVRLHYASQSPDGKMNLELEVDTSTGIRTLPGEFSPPPRNFELGPSLFTQWTVKNPEVTTHTGHLFLEMSKLKGRAGMVGGPAQAALGGTFRDRASGDLLPALIEFPVGPRVRLYDPRTAQWQTFAAFPHDGRP